MPGATPPFIRLLRGYTVNESGCWMWNGSAYKNGYGWLKVFGSVKSAHRYSFELHKGPIPEGLEILHSCDNRRCINPDHLRAGTHKENMHEAANRGGIRRGENHPMFGKKNPRPRQAHKVMVLGKEFSSKNEAERILGLGNGVVSYWIKNSPEKAQLIKSEN